MKGLTYTMMYSHISWLSLAKYINTCLNRPLKLNGKRSPQPDSFVLGLVFTMAHFATTDEKWRDSDTLDSRV